MPGPGNSQSNDIATPKLTDCQASAMSKLAGLVGKSNVGGRTLCCLVGAQGSGKTTLVRAICHEADFGDVIRIPVNTLILELLKDNYPEVFDFPAESFGHELRRWGRRLQDDVADVVRGKMLEDGLTVLDHLELLFALRLNPVTLWYGDAVGRRRVLLVLTGRMSGQKCQVGSHTLTRADQPIVELETAS